MISRILVCAVVFFLLQQHRLNAAQINQPDFVGGATGSVVPSNPPGSTTSFQEQAKDENSPKRIPRRDYLNSEPDRGTGSDSSTPSYSAQDRLAVGRIEGSKLILNNCTAQFIDDIEVPARESGQIIRMDVKEGDPITANQLLAMLDDKLMRVALARAEQSYANARIKAKDQTSIMAAEGEEQLARVQLNRTSTLYKSGSKNRADYEVDEYEYRVAVLKVELAKNTKLEAEGEAKIEMHQIDEVKTRIQRHQAMVDFDGYVIELLKHKLEWVNIGEPIMRVGRMDRLAVVALVSTTVANPYQIRKGQSVVVSLRMAGGQAEQFEGKISQVSLTQEPGGQVIKIKAELDNRKISDDWLLRPDSTVEMVVDLQ